MKIHMVLLSTTLALTAATAWGQSKIDRSFTSSSTNCSDVKWSPEALEKYPKIATACQSVMERDGKYFVKFDGTVNRVADGGRKLTVNFKNGDRLDLTPPEGFSVNIEGKKTSVRSLRPGDSLTFYVPDSQLTADFIEGDTKTASIQEVPMSAPPPQRLASADSGAPMPHTATQWPLVGLIGLGLTAIGGLLTLGRNAHGRLLSSHTRSTMFPLSGISTASTGAGESARGATELTTSGTADRDM